MLLKETGFVEVEHIVFEIPFHPWPEDEHMKDIARWFNLGMTHGLDALTLAPLSRVKGWPRDQIVRLNEAMRKEITTKSLKVSCTL